MGGRQFIHPSLHRKLVPDQDVAATAAEFRRTRICHSLALDFWQDAESMMLPCTPCTQLIPTLHKLPWWQLWWNLRRSAMLLHALSKT